MTPETIEVMELVDDCRRKLRGRAPEVQGAVLADLLAMWLAGHVIEGNPEETKNYRDAMLKAHLKAMRPLIDINYKQFVEPQLKATIQ